MRVATNNAKKHKEGPLITYMKMMLRFLLVIVLLVVTVVLPAQAGIKVTTNPITQEGVQQVQGEMNRDFGQLMGQLDEGNQDKMKANQQEWQKGLNEKTAANPNDALAITFKETSERVCVIDRIIEQLKEKGSQK